MAHRPEPPPAGLALVLVTPGGRDAQALEQLIVAALEGGVTAVLLREPQRPPAERLTLARYARAATRRHGALLLVHRDVELSLACEADGVHTGHGGQHVEALRAAAPGLLVGRSCHWPVDSQDRLADYVLLSPFRPTPASHPRPLLDDQHARACLDALGEVPAVALGGLTAADVPALPDGLAGLAVLRALCAAPDPREAAVALRAAVAARWPPRAVVAPRARRARSAGTERSARSAEPAP